MPFESLIKRNIHSMWFKVSWIVWKSIYSVFTRFFFLGFELQRNEGIDWLRERHARRLCPSLCTLHNGTMCRYHVYANSIKAMLFIEATWRKAVVRTCIAKIKKCSLLWFLQWSSMCMKMECLIQQTVYMYVLLLLLCHHIWFQCMHKNGKSNFLLLPCALTYYKVSDANET